MKLRLLTLDQSITQTGWAVYDTPGPEQSIICGSFSAKEPADDGDKCELFATEVRKLRTKWKPDFMSWEMSSRKISGFQKNADFVDEQMAAMGRPRFTVNAKVLMLPELQGILRGIAVAYLIPHEAVPVTTWRAGMLHNGNMDRDTAKRKAKEMCRMLRIKVANHNEAESAMICLWTAQASQKFKMLRWRREVDEEAQLPASP